ncbi:S1C family serine protease [Pseudoflavonifractor phocaeensis]|uniref:S1C family serine protease n=1 Tax=Pseudoflavonifractor phocaeensis TaxID=1870988 RepID=UPI001F3B0F01|nr:trypsin-like peptidase domain-containing protein [Pseudoflavonifractor phocaeensis]MCF2661974.1 trypsin-like peptidase domain-containing protein [Pseudoflavonifractor phocaeensis]
MSDFNFYNSENDGYRGGFGDYTDPIPTSGGPVGPESTPPKKKGNAKRIAALVLVCALVGGGAGVGSAALYGKLTQPESSTTIYEEERPQVQTVVNTNKGQPMTPEALYAANLPSCVGITVSTTSVNIFGQTTTSAASGSGFVLTQDGYIVTNYHVIEDAANDNSVDIRVTFANGDKYTAKLVGGEKDNDVAVLKIEAAGLTPVTLGDSEKLVVGENVYTIGNPLGELTYSLTNGIISALDRLISTGDNVTLNMLQTNCDINPGNSGGPLFDSYGNVIGITTAKYTQSSSGVSAEGLGFAIPINDVKDIIADLIEHGYVTGKPYMGVQVNTVSSEAQRYGIPAGAAVEYVAEGSCAQKAGLQAGDIITAIDDTAIDSPSALTAALSSNYKAGDTATLTVIRSQQEMKLTITFDEKNAETEANNQIQQNTQQEQQQSQNGYYYQWPFENFHW